MTITWRRSDGKSEYYHGDVVGSRVTVQIGRSTNAGRYVWAVFHEDIGCALFGDETPSLEETKRKAQAWIDQWVKR